MSGRPLSEWGAAVMARLDALGWSLARLARETRKGEAALSRNMRGDPPPSESAELLVDLVLSREEEWRAAHSPQNPLTDK